MASKKKPAMLAMNDDDEEMRVPQKKHIRRAGRSSRSASVEPAIAIDGQKVSAPSGAAVAENPHVSAPLAAPAAPPEPATAEVSGSVARSC